MIGTYPQHLTLLQFLARDHPDQDTLVTIYKYWIQGGFELAWPKERRTWEELGEEILTSVREVMGPQAVQAILRED